MATQTTAQITMPAMGESVTEGTVLEWHAAAGDEIEADETVVEVSTDKVDTEVPAPASGVLVRILVEADETVPVGTVLAEIDVGATPAAATDAEDEMAAAEESSSASVGEARATEAELVPAGAATDAASSPPTAGGNGRAGTRVSDGPDPERAPAPHAPSDGDPPAAADAGQSTVDVALPQMGESVAEGTVLEWHKQVGDAVAADETIVEISTDKVDTEVSAPASGVLAEILVGADETVAVGTVLARIAVGAGQSSHAPAPERPGDAPAPPESPGDAPALEGESAPGAAVRPLGTGEGSNGAAGATPVAARMASAHGLDLGSLTGTGPRGRINKRDVLAAVEGRSPTGAAPAAAASAPAPTASLGGTETALRGPAAMLARFMDESRSIPTATSFRTLEVRELDERRRALKAAGRKLSFTHLIAWAIVEAAREMPVMAHTFAERDGKPVRVTPEGVSLGLAVDAERKDGSRSLVVPVLRGANELDFPTFVARYDELVAGARANSLSPDAYAGANISLTNPGGLGTVASVPRLMPGQGTIVATGSIALPAGFVNADPAALDQLGVSKVMTMTSTYDHRVIQGAESGAFLRRIDQLLQGEDGFYEAVRSALGIDGEAVTAADGTRSAAPAAPPSANGARVTAAEPAPEGATPSVETAAHVGLLQAVQAASSLVKAHRMHGHLAARLDPLGTEPVGDPALYPETVNLTPELMEAIPASILRVAVPGETFAEALPHLDEIYCGTIAYEIEHIADHEARVWLRQAIESSHYRPPLEAEHQRRLLGRLSEVEALENYLHKAFLGKKQFSIEGLDVLVPMLDETIEIAAARGAREVVMGMAHRGRLNVLAHTVGRPYETILVEFEGEQHLNADTAQPEGGTGDVKYHHGAAGTYQTVGAGAITVSLSSNPSHLEYVDPVIEGRARADQTNRKGRDLRHDPNLVVPVQIHGDAAFPGQGVVAETLNLQGLEGYSTGGTLHLITNNQLGFTTPPGEARSTRYASDMAKGFDMPIVHVNADDVEACIAAVRLCMAFRKRFERDAVVDVIGYRRFGHNETDEPAYTQPLMYEKIKAHPPVRLRYAEQLERGGTITAAEAEEMAKGAYARVADAHAELKERMAADPSTGEFQAVQLDRSASHEPQTSVDGETVRRLNDQLIAVPEGFTVHRKLGPLLERRRETLGPEGGIDWGQAEALAWASLLEEGVPIRLTGQDSARGTFSHRHLTLHDVRTGNSHAPIQVLPGATAPFELHNSPLSESAALGFEYGYSAQAPDALVVWEAQFGDFMNGAQVIIDQFITSGLAKWGQTSRLTLLLPHGYEGSGPEHSSARLERFLQMGAEGNIRVANCTTPAQYFHLLRRQALIAKARPLVIMTPKKLLRLPAATSRLEELTGGAFRPVIDDPGLPGEREHVTRLVLCSGKIYYELAQHESRASAGHVAIGRVELLYPFAHDALRGLIDSYPNLREVVWVQEEPQNMGARVLMEARIRYLLPEGASFRYIGRPLRASPSEGYPAAHLAEQSRIVREALGTEAERAGAADPSVERTTEVDPGS
ncbi:MAG: multifunctional oxoglutarate decarboxylase/oxoglutarate dehydrogenase thiamine pyrophosphate-binding subunit/dihydrolipoyllysine-residue succinyltransferase subunit [Thermoleophilaceae bacterium]